MNRGAEAFGWVQESLPDCRACALVDIEQRSEPVMLWGSPSDVSLVGRIPVAFDELSGHRHRAVSILESYLSDEPGGGSGQPVDELLVKVDEAVCVLFRLKKNPPWAACFVFANGAPWALAVVSCRATVRGLDQELSAGGLADVFP